MVGFFRDCLEVSRLGVFGLEDSSGGGFGVGGVGFGGGSGKQVFIGVEVCTGLALSSMPLLPHILHNFSYPTSPSYFGFS